VSHCDGQDGPGRARTGQDGAGRAPGAVAAADRDDTGHVLATSARTGTPQTQVVSVCLLEGVLAHDDPRVPRRGTGVAADAIRGAGPITVERNLRESRGNSHTIRYGYTGRAARLLLSYLSPHLRHDSLTCTR